MLSELLTEEYIQFSDQKTDWEEAIKQVASPLVYHQKIKAGYIDAMIQKIYEFGPFIHIGRRIALPHARPEDGVLELGMSFLKTEKPILLLNDPKHPVQIFICLAAVDNQTHLKALASLTNILSNNRMLDTLLEASTKREVRNVIMEGEK